MVREGWDVQDAAAEFDLDSLTTMDDYFRARRAGMVAIGGREARINAYAAYSNARNHATF
jgi:hypothetical protein